MSGSPPGSVAVVGAGIMGRRIAAVWASVGAEVRIFDANPAAGASVLDHSEYPGQLSLAESLEAAVAGVDLVVEAVTEDLGVKEPVWRRIGDAARRDAVLATNTSAFDIDLFADWVPGPERVLGTHWFNPATMIPCVEVVRGERTSDATIARVTDWLAQAGKQPVVVVSSPGFVANRIQFAMIREAFLCWQEGLATADSIDRIVTESFGLRLAVSGPLRNADLGGLDTYLSIFSFLSSRLGDRFEAPERLVELVEAGRLGVKSGAGISEYEPVEVERIEKERDRRLREIIAVRDEGDRP